MLSGGESKFQDDVRSGGRLLYVERPGCNDGGCRGIGGAEMGVEGLEPEGIGVSEK